MQQSEKVILRSLQLQEFAEEAKLLTEPGKQKGQVTKRRSHLHRLDPYMGMDGLIPVGGRIRRANVPHNLAHPVILPKQGHLTMLVIVIFIGAPFTEAVVQH